MKTFMTVLALIVGFEWGFLYREIVLPKEIGVSPIELTAEEYLSTKELVQPLVPMEIKLKILSNEDFDNVRSSATVAAFTVIGDNNRKCEITIPVRIGKIHYMPGMNYSTYFDAEGWGNIVLTHELLHCIRGSWHG
jgi:hypothetical protein